MTREAKTTHDKTINVWLMFESIFQVEKREREKNPNNKSKMHRITSLLYLFPFFGCLYK